MTDTPSILIVRTQSWLQVTRLTMRLAAYGCRISLICSEDTAVANAPHIHERFKFSLASPVRSLRRAILGSQPDFILPTDDLSVSLLHEVAEQTPSLCALIERSIGKKEFYPLLRSRFRLLSLAHSLGIAVPETELILNSQQLKKWCTPEHPSFVLKKDGTWGGEGVQIVSGAVEARRAFQQLETGVSFKARLSQWLRKGDSAAFTNLQCLRNPEITAQSLVPGIPANAMYACHEGKILGEVQARVVASKGKTGSSLVVTLTDDARISRAGRLLAERLQLSGFFGLDFVLDSRTGEPFLLELNPRATKLGHVAVANQPDLAGYLWAHLTNRVAPVAAPHLGRAICFYPEAEEWTQKTASFLGCRSDVLEGEEEMFALLAARKAPLRTRLRESLWNFLLRISVEVPSDASPQTFYYQDLSESAEGPLIAAVPKGKKIAFAS